MSPKCYPPPPPLDPSVDPDEEIARLAKALGHPARVKILRFRLEREERVVGAIVGELPLAQSTVSQHLRVVREAGLIHGEVDGSRICYCADTRVARLAGLLDALLRRPLLNRRSYEIRPDLRHSRYLAGARVRP